MSEELRRKVEKSKRSSALIIFGTVAFIIGIVVGNMLVSSGTLPNDADWCDWSVCRSLD